MIRGTTAQRFVLLSFLMLYAAGSWACGPQPTTPPDTAVPTSAPPTAVPPTPDTPTYEPLTVDSAGMSFEVPAGWVRLGEEWTWTVDLPDQEGNWIAFNWVDLEPPMEVEAVMLPDQAVVLESEPVELTWGSGRSYTVEIYTPAPGGGETEPTVAAVERHVIIVVQGEEGRRAYDFYIHAPTAEALSTLQPLLEHMVNSAAPSSSTD